MEKLGVIMKATDPTAWVHSLVIAKKKNNKIRVCLDPSDLNGAIVREHFSMQTTEDVISRMSKAKVFSVLDANHGFWHVKLDKESSKLATFNTPFGRYSYTRLAPLRQLLQKDVEWSSGQTENEAFEILKTAISSKPVLKFLNPKEPVSLSVDAS